MSRQLIATIITVLCLIFISAPARAAEKQFDLDALIQRAIEAHGGREAIMSAAALHAKGEIRAAKGNGTYEYWLAREGRRLMVETRYEGSSERRLLSDKKGHRGEGGELVEVAGERYLAMLYQYKHLDLLYGLTTGAYSVRYRGMHDAGGASVHVLMLSDSEGPPMMAYVGVNSDLLLGTSGFFSVGGAETDLTVQLHDYRKTPGGLMLPYTIVNVAGGRQISVTSISSYEINPALPEGTFDAKGHKN